MKIKRWSPEENEILRKFWNGGKQIDDFVGFLPGRTRGAIVHRAHQMGLKCRKTGPKPEMEMNIAKLIKTHGPIGSAEMARMLLCLPQQVDCYVRRLRKARKIHIAGYVQTSTWSMSRQWVFGKGTDAVRPAKVSRADVAVNVIETPSFNADPLMAALFARAA